MFGHGANKSFTRLRLCLLFLTICPVFDANYKHELKNNLSDYIINLVLLVIPMQGGASDSVVMPQVVILAGGLGTRLGDLTQKIPKSLVEVYDKPIIEHILDWISGQGCDRALILTGHLGEQFKHYTHPSVSLTFVQEDQPLGTGGALWNAVDFLEQEFILLWGDDFHPINYQKLVSRHREEGNLMTMTVTESHESMNLRHIDGKIMNYDKHQPSPDFNGYEAGTNVVNKRVVLLFGRDGKWSWEETVYPKMSGIIGAHLDDTKFWDMGTPERLSKLTEFLKSEGA
tara:strand:- start:983 stop:1840 length:858 start_codon:yes stop_codon:yes gene_type:complete